MFGCHPQVGEDGVPFLAAPPILPNATRQSRYAIVNRNSGTYFAQCVSLVSCVLFRALTWWFLFPRPSPHLVLHRLSVLDFCLISALPHCQPLVCGFFSSTRLKHRSAHFALQHPRGIAFPIIVRGPDFPPDYPFAAQLAAARDVVMMIADFCPYATGTRWWVVQTRVNL